MANLRHFAIVVKDQERSARFYEEAFNFKRVGARASEIGSAIFMSDGVVCLALLKYKGNKASGLENEEDFVGPHHFGIFVDDLEAASEKIKQAGGTFFFDMGDKRGEFERKFRDPDGIIFDISHTGWVGTPERAKK
jgi:predicted enzyme related to lactoylglutathione lyase